MLTTLSRFADRGAALLSDIIVRPTLADADFTRVRQLRLDRLKQMKDLPPAVAERAFLRLMYGDHPYGHLAIGSAAALGGMDAGEVASFHRATYGPRRSTLVVAGAGQHEELLGLAQRHFGEWYSADSDQPPASLPRPSSQSSGAVVLVPRESAAQSEMRIGHLAVERNTPAYQALLVM